MPELPEVETTARALRPLLEGHTLTVVTTSGKKLRQPIPNLQHLVGHTVTRITRRSKYILMDISNAHTLLLHLGMSGRLTTRPAAKHDHLTLHVRRSLGEGGTTSTNTIYFNDPRRFGLALLIPTKSLQNHPLLTTLGPEPLENTFTPAYLIESLKTRKTALKPTLMDAKIVVGIGNIYASESLFRARLNPHMPSNKLTLKQAKNLLPHIRQTLTDAITAGGSSLRDFAHSNGQLGNFQSMFNVYGRKGLPCPTCQTPIHQITQAQRSSFYCPKCQK